MNRKQDLQHMHRSFDFDRKKIDTETRTVELAFSSETDGVESGVGVEILYPRPN